MTLAKMDMAQLIPHRGSMVLLESVQSWDDGSIICIAVGHRDPAHPLRDGSILPAICGLEYAAQAIAVHGGLMRDARGTPAAGMLAGVRDLTMNIERLDDISGELTIRADRVAALGEGWMYRFAIRSGTQELLSGRVSVFVSRTDTDISSVSPTRDNGPACTS